MVRPGRSIRQVINISPILGEAPTVPIETEICMAGSLDDIITCAKFQDDIFRDYNVTGGRISHFSIFLLIVAWALQQCSALLGCLGGSAIHCAILSMLSHGKMNSAAISTAVYRPSLFLFPVRPSGHVTRSGTL